MKMMISLSRRPMKQLLAEGKYVKIELYASTGDKFAERFAEFLKGVSNMSLGGSSREVGILDGAKQDADFKDLKVFVDGDGSDKILDVRIVPS